MAHVVGQGGYRHVAALNPGPPGGDPVPLALRRILRGCRQKQANAARSALLSGSAAWRHGRLALPQRLALDAERNLDADPADDDAVDSVPVRSDADLLWSPTSRLVRARGDASSWDQRGTTHQGQRAATCANVTSCIVSATR